MRTRWIALGAGGLLFGIALALVRGQPIAGSDQGVYLSIAARLLDGDHLYRDVVEPKDPLFFYTYAAALWLGDWRGAVPPHRPLPPPPRGARPPFPPPGPPPP